MSCQYVSAVALEIGDHTPAAERTSRPTSVSFGLVRLVFIATNSRVRGRLHVEVVVVGTIPLRSDPIFRAGWGDGGRAERARKPACCRGYRPLTGCAAGSENFSSPLACRSSITHQSAGFPRIAGLSFHNPEFGKEATCRESSWGQCCSQW